MHTVEYFCRDKAGMHESVRSVDFKIDSVMPESQSEVFGTLGDDDWYVSVVNISLSGSDDTSGLDNILYRINEGA